MKKEKILKYLHLKKESDEKLKLITKILNEK